MKIAIVNDRPLMVEALRRALALRPQHQVIWVAKDGCEAVERCAKATPQLILMDLVMPEMDGVEATRRIMARTPCAILIVTSVGTNSIRAFEAMGCGALDAVDTPSLGSPELQKNAAHLLNKLETIERMLSHNSDPRRRARPAAARRRLTKGGALVAIGASAGGPAAVAKVLRGLPNDFPAGIVVIQHVDERFAAGMAEWLGQQSALTVRLAIEGDRLVPGTVLLAGQGNHLVFKTADRLGYTPDPIDYAYRPSVDALFQSVSHHWDGETVGVLLTGMGRDGAVGLRALRNQGHHTIAQDQASSAVYGMPKAAARLNAAVEILPIDEIASRLVEVVACAK